MKKRKALKKRKAAKALPAALFVGLSPDAAAALVRGIVEIARMKASDQLKLEAIRALGNSSASQPTTVSGCTFLAPST